jgi:hypothetical protein
METPISMTRCVQALLACVLGLLIPPDATALITLGEARALASNAATDTGTDEGPALATDGAGNFVAVWVTDDPGLGASVGSQDIAFARSGDSGITWSSAALLYAPATSHGVKASVAFASTGTWVAAWSGFPSVSRSVDGGQTWSLPVDIAGGGTSRGPISVRGDSTGTWVSVWRAFDGMEDRLFVSRSTDDGLTWTPSAPLPDAMTAAQGGMYQLSLATDGSGTWVCVWSDVFNSRVAASRSTDGGLTWSPTVTVDGVHADDTSSPEVATDGSGNWVVAFEGATEQMLTSRSTDDGQSWGPTQSVGGSLLIEYDASRFSPGVIYDNSVWTVFWTQALGELSDGIGKEGDIVAARSFDGGVSWTDLAALNVNAGRDNGSPPFEYNFDGAPRLVAGADGSAVMVYESTNSLGDTYGTDLDIFVSRSQDYCPLSPNVSCAVPNTSGAARLTYKNPSGARDKLQWRWCSGAETLPADFGDPLTSTHYALCVYDDVQGTMRPVMEAHALAGGACKNGPCWTASDDGWRYKDSEGRHGPIRTIRLEPGEDGEASILLKAQGPALLPPPMPFALEPSLRVQLLNTENGECWEAVYSTADTNSAEEFKARSD